MEHKKSKLVLICGCSKLGAHIAQYYSQKGRSVTILDPDKIAFAKLPEDFSGRTAIGDATDIDVMRYFGAEKADIIVAATRKDNTNILVSEMASIIFETPKIYARLNDEDKAELVKEHENIRVLSPFLLCMKEFAHIESEGDFDE